MTINHTIFVCLILLFSYSNVNSQNYEHQNDLIHDNCFMMV
jgi:hypothetical protein